MIRFLQTKGRVQQILLVGFLSIICIMMVVTLIPGGSSLTDFLGLGMNENVVAKVDGQEISVQDVQERARNMARQRYPQVPADKVLPFIIPQVADGMVSQTLFLNEARRLGLRATDTDLCYLLERRQPATALFPNATLVRPAEYSAFLSPPFNLSTPPF